MGTAYTSTASEQQGGSAQHLASQFRGLVSDLSHSAGHVTSVSVFSNTDTQAEKCPL